MKFRIIIFISVLSWNFSYAQKTSFTFDATVAIHESLKKQIKSEGRLYVFLSENMDAEPRTQIWPSPTKPTYIFAKNISGLKASDKLKITNDENWISTSNFTLDKVPHGAYNVQIVWDQDFEESRIDAPGNLYSEPRKINSTESISLDFELSNSIQERKITSHNLAKEVVFKSELLSAWWKKPINLKASILLPHGYDSSKAYPIRYNVAGYGGRYTRIKYLLQNEEAMKWLDSPESPQIISVFLDGEGPFGDSYQLNSENSGPYGDALIKEFIPYIESKFRGTSSADTRFVDGCSTGGWVSLALQLYYPDFFNGVFSYSPDAIDFENYQLINIYQDKNAFTNEFGYSRPVMRSKYGEPMLSLKDFIQYENVLGFSNTYLNSGGQFSAHTALYSPKGSNNLPQPLFDPLTGQMDKEVAEHWKKYDLKLYTKKHWKELGPKLAGKIFIWMGDMDDFYLNPATREFSNFLNTTENPKSDAEIVFSPMAGHCAEYSHFDVLLKMQNRVDSLQKK
ncbi:alpha/beta hydrolase-fold protein [Aurantibacter sp.]|uniref:alpha/beta hydrolase-fold protein n=1 Tax=Aurantibacter sp. TaxID=2807103 RepID=UPI003264683B